MRFFFLDAAPEISEGVWPPPRELQQHLKALRFGSDEPFLLILPDGRALQACQPERGSLQLMGFAEPPRLALAPITLATAWPKGKRAEDLVVRACEAGVRRIQPVIFERSIAGREAISKNQLERLRRIAREVCQQVGLASIPQIASEPIPMQQVHEQEPEALAICLRPGAPSLREVLLPASDKLLTLLVGPEGGTSADEKTWLAEHGWVFAGLLPTILRIEAAGPMGAALCQAVVGPSWAQSESPERD